MNDYDYSIHDARFHDDSEAHATEIARIMRLTVESHVPADRSLAALDIGYGFALRALRDLKFTNLTGLETSPEQAERSRKAGFNVILTDLSNEWLRSQENRFGLVLLLDVLEHVPMEVQIDFLRTIYKAMAPGGRLILTVPNANAILASRWRHIDYTHYSSFTEHSLYFVLKNAGFDKIELDTTKGIGKMPKRLWTQPGRAAFRRWLVRWCWLQVHKSELPEHEIKDISFQLNLKAVATK